MMQKFGGGGLVVHQYQLVGFGEHLLASVHVLANVATSQVQLGGPLVAKVRTIGSAPHG